MRGTITELRTDSAIPRRAISQFREKCQFELKRRFKAVHFLLLSPFLECDHIGLPQIPYPILFFSKGTTAVAQCVSSRHGVRQQHVASRNESAAKRTRAREREREREKNYAMFSADIRALPDGGMLRSFREQLS